MRLLGKWLGRFVLLVAALAAFIWFGPREQVRVLADVPDLPELNGLEAWLASREAKVPNLGENAAKQVIWAGEAGVKTGLSVVYLHGYSANREEIRPLPDEFAKALGANLFFTRLAGHGRDGSAMAEPRAGDWVEDLAEAMAIGRALGERVILLGTSTGGTLAAWAATDPSGALSEGLAGVALMSPNFGVADPASKLLVWPFARRWVPLVAGAERSFEPLNPRQEAEWTTRYPMSSVVSLGVLMAQIQTRDFTRATVPALFYFTDLDPVVDPVRIRETAAKWAGPVTQVVVQAGGGIVPERHVLAGDIVNPEGTAPALAALLDWVDKAGIK